MIKYAVAVTLYYPSEEDINKIYDYCQVFDLVFIYDNTESHANSHLIFNNNKIIYYTTGKNNGLAIAFNKAIDVCVQNSIDYLCTMDQDSTFVIHEIEKIKSYIEKNHSIIMSSIGAIGPFVSFDNCFRAEERVEEKNWIITSGTFLNLSLLIKTRISFDENYFIDRLDKDLCEQIVRSGKKIIVYMNSVLYQTLGEGNRKKNPDHSPLRHYYIFRNRLYYNKKFLTNPSKFFNNIIQSVKHILLILIFEKEKGKKIQMCKKGMSDYKQCKFGKMEQ
ncbi:glycosyltransferase [Clostridium perfringens]